MKYIKKDVIKHKKFKDIVFKVVDCNEENYLLKIIPVLINTIIPISEVEGKNWSKLEEKRDANKSIKKSENSKKHRTQRENNSIQNARKKDESTKTDGRRTQVHRKPSSRSWWKRKKKSSSNTPINNSNKDI